MDLRTAREGGSPSLSPNSQLLTPSAQSKPLPGPLFSLPTRRRQSRASNGVPSSRLPRIFRSTNAPDGRLFKLSTDTRVGLRNFIIRSSAPSPTRAWQPQSVAAGSPNGVATSSKTEFGPGGPVWVKLSAPYRLGGLDPAPYAAAYLERFGPERLLWGSDWPWTQHEAATSYGECVERIGGWLGEDADIQARFDRASRGLYGFAG
ncbi:MAG: amidohydrolase family protein [Planctomycetes bacterium]|nr:amidohydrolase family protein [Planctomycetota bacterium]